MSDLSSTRDSPPRRAFVRIGRALRFLAGVDEKVLDRVPQERAWYAALGGAVLGTAAFAALSMWLAIEEMLDAAVLVAVVPAALWFLIILNLDRWIVTSRPGDGWQRFGLLGTRAILAILVGIVIAEPLVLRVFEEKIEESVRQTRTSQLDFLRGRLTLCNPDPTDDKASPPGDCAPVETLSFADTPSDDAAELVARRADADKLQTSITADSETLRQLHAKARAECVGDKEAGTTGVPGDGPECRLLRAEATRFEQTHPLTERMTDLADIRTRIAELEGTINNAREVFLQARHTAIQARLDEEPQVEDPIGLLERMEALSTITTENFTLQVGVIFVRLLFIAVDLTPVLMKATAGKTSYETIVGDQLRDEVDVSRLALKEKRQDHERERTRAVEEKEKTDRVAFFRSVDQLADAYEHAGAPSQSSGDRDTSSNGHRGRSEETR